MNLINLLHINKNKFRFHHLEPQNRVFSLKTNFELLPDHLLFTFNLIFYKIDYINRIK